MDWGWVVWFLVVGTLLITLGAVLIGRSDVDGFSGSILGLGILLLMVGIIVMLGMGVSAARARDVDGRYAQSPLKSWFDSLRSGKGPCCSDADGSALSDVDWETKGGHYRVRIEGDWYDVPDDAVITEPNRIGKTMVWPIRHNDYRDGKSITKYDIRCFMPGSMI